MGTWVYVLHVLHVITGTSTITSPQCHSAFPDSCERGNIGIIGGGIKLRHTVYSGGRVDKNVTCIVYVDSQARRNGETNLALFSHFSWPRLLPITCTARTIRNKQSLCLSASPNTRRHRRSCPRRHQFTCRTNRMLQKVI